MLIFQEIFYEIYEIYEIYKLLLSKL